ncbi:MAG TPA: phosphopantetheine-binding protein [Streptosporangiaceae bacterium]|nr:phosphopantetheine-binding protein [Streptosporangiaceae bacterium]
MSITSPRPDGTGSRPGAPVSAPGQAEAGATPGEVAALIQEILGIDEMATDENFFDVGGSSMLALTLMSRIEQRWAVTLSLISVIQNPTPELLAGLIETTPPSEPVP